MAKIEKLRRLYKKIMLLSGQEPIVFNKAVEALLIAEQIEDRRPEDYTWAAMHVSFQCDSCVGTGMYVSHIENGVPVGNGGICYRCAGKGRQDYQDIKRNNYYDAHRDI